MIQKHTAGSGLHYVNDNMQFYENGSYQEGDTSDGCILVHLNTIAFATGLPTVYEMWSAAYPDDPMSFDDFVWIIQNSLPYTEKMPVTIENIWLVLDDLKVVGMERLSRLVKHLLCDKEILIG